jgi:hypothetical protein
LQKQNNIEGEKFYLNPFSYEDFNKTPTPQVPTEEELKKEELKKKLKLDAQKFYQDFNKMYEMKNR